MMDTQTEDVDQKALREQATAYHRTGCITHTMGRFLRSVSLGSFITVQIQKSELPQTAMAATPLGSTVFGSTVD